MTDRTLTPAEINKLRSSMVMLVGSSDFNSAQRGLGVIALAATGWGTLKVEVREASSKVILTYFPIRGPVEVWMAEFFRGGAGDGPGLRRTTLEKWGVPAGPPEWQD